MVYILYKRESRVIILIFDVFCSIAVVKLLEESTHQKTDLIVDFNIFTNKSKSPGRVCGNELYRTKGMLIYSTICLGIPGMHNVANITAADLICERNYAIFTVQYCSFFIHVCLD